MLRIEPELPPDIINLLEDLADELDLNHPEKYYVGLDDKIDLEKILTLRSFETLVPKLSKF